MLFRFNDKPKQLLVMFGERWEKLRKANVIEIINSLTYSIPRILWQRLLNYKAKPVFIGFLGVLRLGRLRGSVAWCG